MQVVRRAWTPARVMAEVPWSAHLPVLHQAQGSADVKGGGMSVSQVEGKYVEAIQARAGGGI